jgi:hypothetical protein
MKKVVPILTTLPTKKLKEDEAHLHMHHQKWSGRE